MNCSSTGLAVMWTRMIKTTSFEWGGPLGRVLIVPARGFIAGRRRQGLHERHGGGERRLLWLLARARQKAGPSPKLWAPRPWNVFYCPLILALWPSPISQCILGARAKRWWVFGSVFRSWHSTGAVSNWTNLHSRGGGTGTAGVLIYGHQCCRHSLKDGSLTKKDVQQILEYTLNEQY